MSAFVTFQAAPIITMVFINVSSCHPTCSLDKTASERGPDPCLCVSTRCLLLVLYTLMGDASPPDMSTPLRKNGVIFLRFDTAVHARTNKP